VTLELYFGGVKRSHLRNLTQNLNIRGSQRFSKRAANAASVECGYVQTNSKGEKIMNTYTDTIKSKKEVDRSAHTNLFQNPAIVTVILTLVAAVAIAVFIANRPAIAAENKPAVAYSNALEMQYARPWLEAQNKSVVTYGNALELQYAQPWLNAQKKPVITYGNALELQYAQPWLNKAERSTVITGNLQGQIPLNCSSSMEMFYACKYGFGLP
jgi:hypothetical protein